jgi:hypothetical protein
MSYCYGDDDRNSAATGLLLPVAVFILILWICSSSAV